MVQMFGEGDEENTWGEALLLQRTLKWGDVHGKTCPIWGKNWDFLLLVQLMLSPVSLSHMKVEAGRPWRWMGRRQEHFLRCGLWMVIVVYCWLLLGCSAPGVCTWQVTPGLLASLKLEGGYLHPLAISAAFLLMPVGWVCLDGRYPWCLLVPQIINPDWDAGKT